MCLVPGWAFGAIYVVADRFQSGAWLARDSSVVFFSDVSAAMISCAGTLLFRASGHW